MKKVLKYFLLTIVVVLLGFISVGLLHPSYTYTNSIEIDCTVEEAFASFTVDIPSTFFLFVVLFSRFVIALSTCCRKIFILHFAKLEKLCVLTELEINYF